MGEFALGQPVPRFEDPRLLRGGGRYVDDMVLPRMVFGHVLRSPHAHARIARSIRRRAKAAPGVLAVLTGADWEASGWRDLPSASGNRRRDGSPAYRPRFPALVKDRVRWVGDYVAFVVAETRHQAADAAELIEVEYEPLPAIVSTEDAAKAGHPAGVGGVPRQHLVCLSRRRQGGDRRRLRRRRAHRQAQIRDQPGDRRDDGAARLDRRLQRRRGPLHDLHDPAAHPRLSRRAVEHSAACRRAGCASSPATSAAALA